MFHLLPKREGAVASGRHPEASSFLPKGLESALVLKSPDPRYGQGLETPVPNTTSVWSLEGRLQLPLLFGPWSRRPFLKTQSTLMGRECWVQERRLRTAGVRVLGKEVPTHITDRGADFISTISQQVSVERLFLRKSVESEFLTDGSQVSGGGGAVYCLLVY